VRSGIAQAPWEGRGIRDPGHRRKETAGEFATRPFGCVYHSMPGGLPYRRLTFTLRDPRAPGLLEVRGFLFARDIGHPVREGDPATRHESEGNRMHDDHCQNLKGPNRGTCSAVLRSSNGRGTRATIQAATGSRDREPPKTYDDEWGLPQGRHRPPCSGQISH
jgi:hypothetical protein